MLSTTKKPKSFPNTTVSTSIPSQPDWNDDVRTPEKPKSHKDLVPAAVSDCTSSPSLSDSGTSDSHAEASKIASHRKSLSLPCQLNEYSNSGLGLYSDLHPQNTYTSVVNFENTGADNHPRMGRERGSYSPEAHRSALNQSQTSVGIGLKDCEAKASSDDDFEAFLDKLKSLDTKECRKESSGSSFIVSTSGSPSVREDSFDLETVSPPNRLHRRETNRLKSHPDPSHIWSSPELIENESGKEEKKEIKSKTNNRDRNRGACVLQGNLRQQASLGAERSHEEFLYSLYPLEDSGGHEKENRLPRHPSAERYVKHFKANRVALSTRLFDIFNKTVFADSTGERPQPLHNRIDVDDSKPPSLIVILHQSIPVKPPMLPSELEICWNPRLRKTAGLCKYLKRQVIPVKGETTVHRSARIELSTKICTTPERLRDTLLHEACHAAVWIVDGVREHHGRHWQRWAHGAKLAWPNLPMVMRCHNYHIDTPFTYRCLGCGASINRHSKSIDIERKVCGRCHGRFELIHNRSRARSRSQANTLPPSTPGTQPGDVPARTPAFAEFVKRNYRSVRQKRQQSQVLLKPGVGKSLHAEVMAELAGLFKEVRLDDP